MTKRGSTKVALDAVASLTFPGGSKTRVERAGDAVRENRATPEDLMTIDSWREAHRHVLNTFQAILRTRTRKSDIVVAQRHKRKRTIFGKLQRFRSMSLSRMDDVAGCRLIFPDRQALVQFRAKFHQASFRHKLRNDPDKWDYIKRPKPTGYRGIHDVYEYDVKSTHGKAYKGLLIELHIGRNLNTHGLHALKLLASSRRVSRNFSKAIDATSEFSHYQAR